MNSKTVTIFCIIFEFYIISNSMATINRHLTPKLNVQVIEEPVSEDPIRKYKEQYRIHDHINLENDTNTYDDLEKELNLENEEDINISDDNDMRSQLEIHLHDVMLAQNFSRCTKEGLKCLEFSPGNFDCHNP